MKRFVIASVLCVLSFSVVTATGPVFSAQQEVSSGKAQELLGAFADLQELKNDLNKKEVALNFEKTLTFPSLKEIEKIDEALTIKFRALETLQDTEGEDYEGIYVLEEQINDLKQQRQYFEDTYTNRREKQGINITNITNEIEDLQEEIQKQQQIFSGSLSKATQYFGVLLGIIFLLFLLRYVGGILIRRFSLNLAHTRQEALQKINKITFNIIIGLFIFGGFFSQMVNLLPFIAILGTGMAFAVRDAISSFIGWFVIGSKRGFDVGDIIRAGNVFGKVYEIGPFLTVVQEIKYGQKTNRFFSFPNKIVFEQEIEHFSYAQGIGEKTISFWVSAGADIEALEKELLKLAENTKRFSFVDIENPIMKKIFEKIDPHVLTQPEAQGIKLSLIFFAEMGKVDRVASEITKAFLSCIKKKFPGALIGDGGVKNVPLETIKLEKKQKDNSH